MSHIFDALQRSETERAGVEGPEFSLVTELLQAAEREAAAERQTSVEPEATVQREAAALVQEVPTSLPTAVAQTSNPAVEQFSQFQSLRVQVPPQSRLVSVTDKGSLAAEKFRFLGVRLRQLQQSRPLKKVLITSTIPEEGKSMVAANLACTLARRAPQKILLVEGDLRRPAITQMFGFGKFPGMIELLQGERGPMQSIYHLEGSGVWLLPAGSSPRNPMELMQSGRLSALMDQLAAWFDWIVIDSPPILPLADTSIWMRLADGILLVSRPGITQKQQLCRGLEAIEPTKLVGALLNGSTTTPTSDYYYHYGRTRE
jgi:capsular exopolysaccharide synthesis family protein